MRKIITLALIATLSACANAPQQLEQLEALARYHRAQNAAQIANEAHNAAVNAKLIADSELTDARAKLDEVLSDDTLRDF